MVGAVAKRAVLADRLDKQKLLTEVVVNELQYHARRIEHFCAESSEFRRYVAENFRALTIDALKKAEQTRSNDRIRRIGQILVNSVTVNPPATADVTEELMRTAMQLSDRDALFLGEIYNAQFRFFDNARGIAAVVHEFEGGVRQLRPDSWPLERLRNAGFDHADLMAIPAKLVSLGLVQPFEWLDGPPYPHFLLRNGLLFVRYARSHSEKFAE
ncbi:MAG TPA: hypothetical protein VN428_15505 [Bryobacteraceae bacterium]|nr:hypothetical protein [Bryobacteraceae bacterium]